MSFKLELWSCRPNNTMKRIAKDLKCPKDVIDIIEEKDKLLLEVVQRDGEEFIETYNRACKEQKKIKQKTMIIVNKTE